VSVNTDWISMAEDRKQWRALVNMTVLIRFIWWAAIFFFFRFFEECNPWN